MRANFFGCFMGVQLSLTAITSHFVCAETRSPDGEGSVRTKIEVIIDKINISQQPLARIDLAKQLVEVVKQAKRADDAGLDARVVDDLTALLIDRQDAVRAWAAAALGRIGPQAKSALPALERAQKEASPPPGTIGPSLSSEGAIDLAIKRIKTEGSSTK